MMTLQKKGMILVVFLLVVYGGYRAYSRFTYVEKKLYHSKKPVYKDIEQVIHASGQLQVEGNIKIGSLVAGVVKELLVEENDSVEKGQLLTLLDNGRDDSLVIEARGRVQAAQATLTYRKAFYQRQEQLYKSGQLSQDNYEQALRDYQQAEGLLISAQGLLKSREIEYSNLRIVAPDDGTIVNVGIALGQRVTTDLDATILFQMGKDLSQMEGIIEIDESDVGQIKVGQKVTFNVDTYSDRMFKGKISQISFSPTIKGNNKFYRGTIEVKNKDGALRPGMSINANIKVADAKNSLAVTHQVFQIEAVALKAVAQQLKYEFIPILKSKKQREPDSASQHQTKYVWVVKDKSFVEKAITIDVTDDIFFEVKDGLDPDDELIVDVEEANQMEQVYKKMFGGSL